MRNIFSIILFISFFFSIAQESVEGKLDYILSIMFDQPDTAISLSHDLMDYSKDVDSDYGLVQSNYILGYIYDKIQVNYGKSIIFYLEALRYAENANFDQVLEKRISLNKNCGVIFRKFRAHDLAIQYYNKSLYLAKEIDSKKQVISISYNMAGLYSDMGMYPEAINLLEQISFELNPDDAKFFDLNNRLCQIYLDHNQSDKASILAQKLISSGDPDNSELIDTHQILGRVALREGLINIAEQNFKSAIEIALNEKDKYTHNKGLFETYNDLGTLYYNIQEYKNALKYYSLAEERIDLVSQKPEYFRVHKSAANTYFKLGDFQKAKIFEDKYSNSLNDYLKTQEVLQEKEKRYNIDLITKRYFDEVAKQERIASILLYSKLISGSLLALLLLTIGYNWYQKIRLRRSIIEELTELKVIS